MAPAVPPSLLYTPLRAGYLPGETVQTELVGLDGQPAGQAAFTIEAYAGSGFAGQVYRARPGSGWPYPGEAALKVLRPRPAWKQAFRDLMFWVSFQALFAPRLRETAVRAGLAWQEILRVAAAEELGAGSVARPYGYFWDTGLGSYVEVHEWITGRPARYETDERLLARWLGRTNAPPQTEMARKRRFMDRLAGLCRRAGAEGAARQFEWYTMVSQANVLTRAGIGGEDAPGPGGLSEFTAIDCRPGLAFPFFIPFTLVHLRIIFEGLRRGVLVHYAEADFSRLGAYLAGHPGLARPLGSLVDRLRADDADARAGLPDLWHTRLRFFGDPAFRARLRAAALEDWIRLGLAAPDAARRLAGQPARFALLYLLSLLPWLGPNLVRLAAHPRYRAHLRALAGGPAYRRRWLECDRDRDLAGWLAGGRISPPRAERLRHSLVFYLCEKGLLSWLPRRIHRLLVDPAARAAALRRVLLEPLRLLASHPARVTWLEGLVREERERGLLSAAQVTHLLAQVREPQLRGFARDLGFTAGLDVVSRLAYLLLGAYALTSGNFFPLAVAALGPIPPSGPLRVLYLLGRVMADLVRGNGRRPLPQLRRLLLARLFALLVAPWRWAGNLFPVFELSVYYPDLALLLTEHYATRASGVIPVFGGKGKLLEYWAFQWFYNLPVCILHQAGRR
jgi:hypothetical protein